MKKFSDLRTKISEVKLLDGKKIKPIDMRYPEHNEHPTIDQSDAIQAARHSGNQRMMDYLDAMRERRRLKEGTSLKDESIPAPMLVLRRKGVRVFPDGKHVALYTNDKYNLVFTVPYGGSATAGEPLVIGQPNA